MTATEYSFNLDLAASPYLLLNLALTALLLGLVLALAWDPYIGRKYKRIILIILLLEFSLIVDDVLIYRLTVGTPHVRLRTILGIYGYSVRPVLILLLSMIIDSGKIKRAAWILTGINAAVYLSALFSPVAFRISSRNRFSRGPLGHTCFLITAVLLANMVFLVMRQYGRARPSEIALPVFNTVLIVCGTCADLLSSSNYPASCLNVSITISCALFYIWLHQKFVQEHEEDLKAQQRIRIMISQIQPHFLYNTLSTIQALCETDPKAARRLVEKFGLYLRQNIESLSRETLIPIRKEMEHTRIYAEIEEVRFENIRVEYDIRDTDFSVPALTVQPLVENAIRHGIRMREKGLVRICAVRKEHFHEIVVEDNGRGFDAGLAEDADGKHIGIRNVRERIEKLCGGTMLIDSRIGEGTTVTIRIPCRNMEKEAERGRDRQEGPV